MTPEETLARQIILSASLATLGGNTGDMGEAIKLAEEAIREAIQKALDDERQAIAKEFDAWKPLIAEAIRQRGKP
jgi:hypothetical protein